nr:MAG TPA: hypothetical protein [Caudoviricetes sp.]
MTVTESLPNVAQFVTQTWAKGGPVAQFSGPDDVTVTKSLPNVAQFGPAWPSSGPVWPKSGPGLFVGMTRKSRGWPSLAQNWATSWARTFRWNDAEKSGSWPSFEELPYIVREF